MGLKVILVVVLFQLSASVVPTWCQTSTFPAGKEATAASSSSSNSREGRNFGFWSTLNAPPSSFSFGNLDQDTSYSLHTYSDPFVSDESRKDDGFTSEDSSFGRQFPFFPFPFPAFPQQPSLQPPIFNFPQFKPWWQGDNVCVDKDEIVADWVGPEAGVATQPDYSLNLQACTEEQGKYVCKTTTNRGGKKLTIVETRACCRGYARFPKRQPNAPCVKVETVTFKEAAKRYGYSDFAAVLQKANISDDVIQMSTLLLPLKSKDPESDNNAIDAGNASNSAFNEDIHEYLIPHKMIDLESVDNEDLVKTTKDHVIRFNVYPRSGNSSNSEYPHHYTANCVPVLKPKIFATEGMVLGLEKELIVAEQSLMDLVRERDNLKLFAQMMEKFNFTEMLDKRDALTVLAPNDNAFANLDAIERHMLMTGDACASEYAASHILGLTFCSSAVVKNARAYVNNLLQNQLSFERMPSGDILINHVAKTAELDLMATNGVAHVIEKLLPSDASMTVSSLLKKRNSSIFAQLLASSGYAEELEALRGVTLFVPTDEAMENSVWKAELDKNSSSLIRNYTLYKFLANHIVQGIIGSHEFRTGYLKTLSNETVKMNFASNSPSTLNCARITQTDGVSCNRAVHQISRPLDVPTLTLWEALESNKDYTKFVKIIKRANMTHLIDDNLTVLVPTNDVFAEQGDFYQELMHSPVFLENFVKRHLILNSICCSAFPKYPTVNSVQSVSGMSLLVTRYRRPTIGNAHITKCDSVQRNGVILEINDIIESRGTEQRTFF